MSEFQPPEQPQYQSPRDEVLHTMATEGWAVKSDGDMASPVGWFSYLNNLPAELPSVTDAFSDEISRTDLDPAELLGSFIVRERSQPPIEVVEHASPVAGWLAFKALQSAYTEWVVGGST